MRSEQIQPEKDAVISFYKKEGETPLESLDRLRIELPEYAADRLSYAGRLDPMAEGLLLVLVGAANDRRAEYLSLGKEYEVEVLFGVSTDSYDVLGVVTDAAIGGISEGKGKETSSQETALKAVQSFVGTRQMPYPAYSSRTVGGRPLIQWAKEGRLGEIEMPTRAMTFSSIEALGFGKVKALEIYSTVAARIAKVNGDFRQTEVLASWDKTFNERTDAEADVFLPLLKLRVRCDSGAYMRTLAHELGKRLGVPALAWSIVRTKVDF